MSIGREPSIPQEPSADDKKRMALSELFVNRSIPDKTLKEQLGELYDKRVADTDQPDIKLVKRYDNDPTPDKVSIDENGRVSLIENYVFREEYFYDDEGYVIRSSRTEKAGQGWDRDFIYRTHCE